MPSFKQSYLFFILAASLLMTGMSPPPPAVSVITPEEELKLQVSQSLNGLKTAYESENLADFMNILDRDFQVRLTFESNLENYFISNKTPEIIFITDSVLTDKDKVNVRAHWFKKSFTNSGVFSKTQGSMQLVFHGSAEGLKLLYLRGDNPFF